MVGGWVSLGFSILLLLLQEAHSSTAVSCLCLYLYMPVLCTMQGVEQKCGFVCTPITHNNTNREYMLHTVFLFNHQFK